MFKKSMIIICLLLFSSTSVFAQNEAPFQIALWETLQLQDKETSIRGLRISLIYGVNENVTGVDWGLVQQVNGDFLGWQVGVVNLVYGNGEGLQKGLYTEIRGNFKGWQTSGVNVVKGEMTGFTSGIVNSTGKMNGVMFGFVNIAQSLYGLQIGLININHAADPFKFLPIINFSF